MVPEEALPVTQLQVAQAKARGTNVVRQADQLVCNLLVLGVELGLLAVKRLTDDEHRTGTSRLITPLCAPPHQTTRACETAVLLLSEVLVGDFHLEFLFHVHLLEPAVLVIALHHARHH